MCACFSCFHNFSSPFYANAHKKAQSPMCCVRKLEIFHRKCDWPEMERVLPMNPAIGFHEKYSQVHVFLAAAIFPFLLRINRHKNT